MPAAAAVAANQCQVTGVTPLSDPEARANVMQKVMDDLAKTIAGNKEADSKAEKQPWEDRGLTAAEQIGLKMQHEIGLQAAAAQAERDKRAAEAMDKIGTRLELWWPLPRVHSSVTTSSIGGKTVLTTTLQRQKDRGTCFR